MGKKVIVFVMILIGTIGIIVWLLSMLTFNREIQPTENFNGDIKEFNIIAKTWEFDPSVIEVNKGDKIILNIKSVDIVHGIAIPEFKISRQLNPGKEINIEFIADKSGEFNFFCNIYCGDGHKDMNGKLIVK